MTGPLSTARRHGWFAPGAAPRARLPLRAGWGHQGVRAESALHAPAAGLGQTAFHPDFIEKAAVLIVRLARNHPLPDGKQARCLGFAVRIFVEINGWWWNPLPGIDDTERSVIAIIAGDWDEERTAGWLRKHLDSAHP